MLGLLSMGLFCFARCLFFLHSNALTQAATIPTPVVLNSALLNDPFNLSLQQDVKSRYVPVLLSYLRPGVAYKIDVTPGLVRHWSPDYGILAQS